MHEPELIELVPVRTHTQVLATRDPKPTGPQPFVSTRQSRWDARVCSQLVTLLILGGQLAVMLVALAMLSGVL